MNRSVIQYINESFSDHLKKYGPTYAGSLIVATPVVAAKILDLYKTHLEKKKEERKRKNYG